MQEIKRRHIDTNEINPMVLKVGFYETSALKNVAAGTKLPDRLIHDYEINFFARDGGIMINEGREYDILKSCMTFRRPGQLCSSYTPYSCWFIYLDLTGGLKQPTTSPGWSVSPPEYLINPLLDIIPDFLKIKNSAYMTELFTAIKLLSVNKSDHAVMSLKIKVLELLNLVAEEAERQITNDYSIKENQIVTTAINYINDNFSKKISLLDISKTVNYSPVHLHRTFRRKTLMTPGEFLLQVRLDYAQHLLLNTDMKYSEIALASGFNTSAYFCYVFRKCHNMTPNEYKSAYLLSFPAVTVQ
ncbi:MAG: AraC family transcriptional regulator [Eubacteriales bacterium]|nr:AraC family transcriptional regulator [Eubacteriales bacterium]